MKISSRRDRKYSVVPYQESWKTQFEDIKSQISPVFGDDLVAIEHVGSTSIIGMSAKPTIDILVIVRDVTAVDQVNPQMESLGYVPLGDYVASNGRLFALEKNHERLVNVHCFEADHPNAIQMLTMRDYLQSHPNEAREYAAVKLDLNRRYDNDYESYRRVKDEYLIAVEQRAYSWKEHKE